MLNELLGFAGFAFVGSITPGPSNALLWASGIRCGFRRTAPHVVGTASGMAALVLAVAAGIGALLTAAPGAEVALKVAGSAYLLWLATRMVRGGLHLGLSAGAGGPPSLLASPDVAFYERICLLGPSCA